MEYRFQEIEKKWQHFWKTNQTYRVEEFSTKPPFYVLDMFPYPSGAGLHVGHPLGYIASDIFARYKKHIGFNVLHPMGYDSFGLPAEQYAIQTGQHPAKTTKENIDRYREQLDKLGFNYDWSREIRTSSPSYYKWTQWIFMQLFDSWYNPITNKAEPISELIKEFEQQGLSLHTLSALHGGIEVEIAPFSSTEWAAFSVQKQQEILMNFRLAYLGESYVNWCPALGTVLANDEVVNGVSERGGHPVERKLLKQWSMRITAYAQRLLEGLDRVDWFDSIKETQRNWIGRSEGASVHFPIINKEGSIEVFTTRPDTLFGVSFLTLAPEHELVTQLTTHEQREAVETYVSVSKNRSERERMADVNTISGVFTGSYAAHPFTKEPIPIWVGDYVLVGYGTGAVMAVPAHDDRDFKFASHFSLPINQVIVPAGEHDFNAGAWSEKSGTLINSDFLNGLSVAEAVQRMLVGIEELGVGSKRINYRLRDAVFGRQRYWGEPIPVYFKGDIPYLIPADQLPLDLPEVDKYLPTEAGDPPLGRATHWKFDELYEYEKSTMPGWAGSSWYFIRYLDPTNESELASPEKIDYWGNVDLYMGGSEHATGHLLYARFWCKFLYDLGIVPFDEPFKKMINQGMILGRSSFVYRVVGQQTFVSAGMKDGYETTPIHVDISLVNNDELDLEGFKAWRSEYQNATFILEPSGVYLCGHEVEKMSKSKYNVQTPDELVDRLGADTLRMYEMFLGPVEQSKPWDTKGITGVHGFLKKYWRLFHLNGSFEVNEATPSKDHFKTLHKTIRKIREDLDRFSFNTGVSNFMICVNELTESKCNFRQILEPLTILLAPYAPHITEELWEKLGNKPGSLYEAPYPVFNPEYLIESDYEYPVSFNGRMRFKISLPLSLNTEEIQAAILSNTETIKWLEGKSPKKVIIVPGKIVNVVI
ncbi:MAG: leucine--tRNA ligase [Flavobacteriales bacterium]